MTLKVTVGFSICYNFSNFIVTVEKKSTKLEMKRFVSGKIKDEF